MSEPIKTHEDCPDCGHKGCLTVYDDHTYCHSCSKWTRTNGETKDTFKEEEAKPLRSDEITSYPHDALTDRGISKEISEEFQVRVKYSETDRSITHHYYPYYLNGKVVGYKVRDVEKKDFYVVGSLRGCELFGQNICHPGKMVVVTEGECDAMAAKQMFRQLGKNYNVVSIPNGASSVRALKDNMKFLESYDKIVLCFDNDEPGQKGIEKAVSIFSIGKATVARLPMKDANDMLKAGKHTEFYEAVGNAAPIRPDGIVSFKEGWDFLWEDEDRVSVPYPWEDLNHATYGLRKREITTITAGSGVGKSQIVRELEHHLWKSTTDNIGVLALEESVGKTEWGVMSIEANIPLMIKEERWKHGLSKDSPEVRDLYERIFGSGRFYGLNHFGSANEEEIMWHLRYLIKAYGCEWLIVDHLNMIVSGMDDNSDERKTIDRLMTRFRMLVEETGVGMILVVHLKRTSSDKGHEQGLEVSLSHLRGSQAIAQISDMVIAAERNQQAENPMEANTTRLRVLKNRYAGITGPTSYLYYDRDTGRMREIDPAILTDPDGSFEDLSEVA